MLSTIGKTTRRAANNSVTKAATKVVAKVSAKAEKKSAKASEVSARSDSHRVAIIEWLKEDVANQAALLEVALEIGDASDLMAGLRLITEAGGGVAKIAADNGSNSK